MLGHPNSSHSWRRNLYAVWLVEFIAISGFQIVVPILPLYVRQLGVDDERAVKIWAGVVFFAHGVTMGITSPVWGALSDRHGRKLMVGRAIISGAVLMTLMGYVRNVQELAFLRAVQGAFTGTITAASTLVASDVPRERAGYALGMVQTAVFAGFTVGPLIGGGITEIWGYRVAFQVAGGVLLLASVVAVLFVREPYRAPKPQRRASVDGRRWSLRDWVPAHFGPVFDSAPLVSILGICLFVRSAEQSVRPTLPLFVEEMVGVGGKAAYITGVVNGSNAAAKGLGALSLGRFCDRWGQRKILLASVLASIACYVPQVFVKRATWLVVLQAGAGVAMGGIVAALSTALAKLAEKGGEGAVYGANASVESVADTIGPILGSALAIGLGLRTPFVLVTAIFALSAMFILRRGVWGARQADQ